MSKLPNLGDIVLSKNEKYKEHKINLFDQLDISNGLTINKETHPALWEKLEIERLSFYINPMISPTNDGNKYRIIADLTGE